MVYFVAPTKRKMAVFVASAALSLVGAGFAVQAFAPSAAAVPDESVTTILVPRGLQSAQGVGGTTQADLDAFAVAFNAQRTENGLLPVPAGNIRYDPCMEQRLFWMAEDPSPYVASAWGHTGSKRSDGVPSVGCDGNLAGGLNDSGATVAVKWWNSLPHRASLYKPVYRADISEVCIYFAMSHGGVPDEPAAFVRAAARWGSC